jgi:hypothetical protein
MKIADILYDDGCVFEQVFVDDDDNILSEAAIRQFKRCGSILKRKYRCLAGPKKGKLVSKPGGCGTRKDPKSVRKGKKVMRSKKGVIQMKSKMSKRKAMSRMVTKLNKQLAGK